MHEYGRGGAEKDDSKALALYKLAANQGNFNLYRLYREGRGGSEKNPNLARAHNQEAVQFLQMC